MSRQLSAADGYARRAEDAFMIRLVGEASRLPLAFRSMPVVSIPSAFTGSRQPKARKPLVPLGARVRNTPSLTVVTSLRASNTMGRKPLPTSRTARLRPTYRHIAVAGAEMLAAYSLDEFAIIRRFVEDALALQRRMTEQFIKSAALTL